MSHLLLVASAAMAGTPEPIDPGIAAMKKAKVEIVAARRVEDPDYYEPSFELDLHVERFDRFLDPNAITVEGLEAIVYACLGPGGTAAHCREDEGPRKVRVRFAGESYARPSVAWYGQELELGEVETVAAFVALPQIDHETELAITNRRPKKLDLRAVALPGRTVPFQRAVAVVAEIKGAPPSFGPGNLWVEGGMDGPSRILCHDSRGREIPRCIAGPAKGSISIVVSVPETREGVEVYIGDDPPREIAIEPDGSVPPGVAVDTEATPIPVTPSRAWALGGSLVGVELDGAAQDVRDLSLWVPEGLVGWPIWSNCYADDAVVPCTEEVDRTVLLFPAPPAAEKVVLAFGGRQVGEPLKVGTDGPELDPETVGDLLADDKEYEAAIPFYENAVVQDPENGGLLYTLGWTHHKLNHHAEAKQWCERSLAFEHRWRNMAYIIIGASLDEAEDYEGALANYEAAQAEFPADPLIHFNKGLTYWAMDDQRSAERLFLRAVEGDAARAVPDRWLMKTAAQQREFSLAAIAALRALLFDGNLVDVRQSLRTWVTTETAWPDGSPSRGPLGDVQPRELANDDDAVAKAQMEYLIYAWAKAAEEGHAMEQHRTDPWYVNIAGLIQRIVEEDLVAAASEVAVLDPYARDPALYEDQQRLRELAQTWAARTAKR